MYYSVCNDIVYWDREIIYPELSHLAKHKKKSRATVIDLIQFQIKNDQFRFLKIQYDFLINHLVSF